MKATVRVLKRRLDQVVGSRTERWLSTVFINYEGMLDLDSPQWMEIWHDDTLTIYRHLETGELAGGFIYRKRLTARQAQWL